MSESAPADAARGNLVDRYAPVAARPYLRMARIDLSLIHISEPTRPY